MNARRIEWSRKSRNVYKKRNDSVHLQICFHEFFADCVFSSDSSSIGFCVLFVFFILFLNNFKLSEHEKHQLNKLRPILYINLDLESDKYYVILFCSFHCLVSLLHIHFFSYSSVRSCVSIQTDFHSKSITKFYFYELLEKSKSLSCDCARIALPPIDWLSVSVSLFK